MRGQDFRICGPKNFALFYEMFYWLSSGPSFALLGGNNSNLSSMEKD